MQTIQLSNQKTDTNQTKLLVQPTVEESTPAVTAQQLTINICVSETKGIIW